MTKLYLGVIFVIHILVHANNNLRAKFEMPSITCCKYMMVPKQKSQPTLTTPSMGANL